MARDWVVSKSSPRCHLSPCLLLQPWPTCSHPRVAFPTGKPCTPQLVPHVEGHLSSSSLPASADELVPICRSTSVTGTVPPHLSYSSNATCHICVQSLVITVPFVLFLPQLCTTTIIAAVAVVKQHIPMWKKIITLLTCFLCFCADWCCFLKRLFTAARHCLFS